jgi:hypothetical protein
MRNCYLICSVLCLLSSLAAAQPLPSRRTPLPEALKEVSGMTRLPGGDLWMLNDSRNPPILFRYDALSGQILESRRLPVPNRDWEDLTNDPSGRLYVGDFGNNYNRRQDLRIYIYDPASGALDSILFRYPDQKAFPPARVSEQNFNCEAMVYFQDSLHLFSKNVFKGNGICKHYVLPAKAGQYTAELRDSIRLKKRVVTGAALSQDGKTLALTAYIIGKKLGVFPYTKADVFYFSDFKGSRFFTGKKTKHRLPKFLIARQFESVTHWAGDCWLVANEGRKPQFQAIWRTRK